VKDVLFITAGRVNKPSTRQRVIQFFPFLKKNKITFSLISFETNPIINIFNLIKIIIFIPFHRIVFFQKVYKRKKFLYQWALLFRKKIVFDLDDAVFYKNNSSKLSQHKTDLDYVLKKSDHVIVGNNYLHQYSKRFATNTTIIPSLLDEQQYKLKKISSKKDFFGWIGTSFNPANFKPIIDDIINLLEKQNQKLLIISNQYDLPQSDQIDFIKWQLNNHFDYFSMFSVGLMPLENNDWNKGKCAFKLLEYIFMERPFIASAVGMNNEVLDCTSGYLAKNISNFPTLMKKAITNYQKLNNKALKASKRARKKYGLRWFQHETFINVIQASLNG